MILDRFDNDLPKYYEWSLEIRQMVIYSDGKNFTQMVNFTQLKSYNPQTRFWFNRNKNHILAQ